MNCELEYKNELNCEELTNLQDLKTNFKLLRIKNHKENEMDEYTPSKSFFHVTFFNLENSTITSGKFLKSFPNLIFLIMRNNQIKNSENISFGMTELRILQHLDLSKNPIKHLRFLNILTAFNLLHLDVSWTNITEILKDDLKNFKQLKTLKVIGCKLKIIQISELSNIKKIYFNKTNLNIKQIQSTVIHLKKLEEFYSSSFQLCCILKNTFTSKFKCSPTTSLIKNCFKMIKYPALTIYFWTIGVSGVFGNIFSMFFLIFYFKSSKKIYRILLSTSDLLTSIYVCWISILNVTFGVDYIYQHAEWTKGIFCKINGIIFEVSFNFSQGFSIIFFLQNIFHIAKKEINKKKKRRNDTKKFNFEQFLILFIIFYVIFSSFIPFFFMVFYFHSNEIGLILT